MTITQSVTLLTHAVNQSRKERVGSSVIHYGQQLAVCQGPRGSMYRIETVKFHNYDDYQRVKLAVSDYSRKCVCQYCEEVRELGLARFALEEMRMQHGRSYERPVHRHRPPYVGVFSGMPIEYEDPYSEDFDPNPWAKEEEELMESLKSKAHMIKTTSTLGKKQEIPGSVVSLARQSVERE